MKNLLKVNKAKMNQLLRPMFFALLVLITLSSTAKAQSYELSAEAVSEYKELMSEMEDMGVGEKILGVAAFWDIFNSDPISGTFSVVIGGCDWGIYSSAFNGYGAHVRARMQEVCGAKALRPGISNADRRFWEKLYNSI